MVKVTYVVEVVEEEPWSMEVSIRYLLLVLVLVELKYKENNFILNFRVWIYIATNFTDSHSALDHFLSKTTIYFVIVTIDIFKKQTKKFIQ